MTKMVLISWGRIQPPSGGFLLDGGLAMKRSTSRRSILIATLFLLTPVTAFAAGQVGEAAAEFNLFDTNGVNHRLSAHLGEVVYLFMVGHN
jgi:hypothetical protein